MALVRRAYEEINPPFSVQPVAAQPGEPVRVLGMGQFPPFICDLAYVPDPTNYEQVKNRMTWLLLAPDGDENGFCVLDYLKAIFGPDVREVTE